MHYLSAINYTKPQKSLKLLLSQNLSIITSRRFIKHSKCFIQNPQGSSHLRNISNSRHVQLILSQNLSGLRFLPVRKFTSTKAAFSDKGPNKAKVDKQVVILSVGIISAAFLCIYSMLIMEYHQDYVIIDDENENEK